MEKTVKAGIIVLGSVAVLVAGALVIGEKPPPGTCEVSAAGVGLIADSLKERGRAVSVALAAGGAVAANKACENFIKSLDDDPNKQLPVKVQTDTGTVEKQVSGRQLTAPP